MAQSLSRIRDASIPTLFPFFPPRFAAKNANSGKRGWVRASFQVLPHCREVPETYVKRLESRCHCRLGIGPLFPSVPFNVIMSPLQEVDKCSTWLNLQLKIQCQCYWNDNGPGASRRRPRRTRKFSGQSALHHLPAARSWNGF